MTPPNQENINIKLNTDGTLSPRLNKDGSIAKKRGRKPKA